MAITMRHSPFHNQRPTDCVIDLIILHAISLPAGDFNTTHVEALFSGHLEPTAHPSFAELAGVTVSAHFVVDRQGNIDQYVACEARAWHAGASIWQGRENCNDYSIGIEMIGDEQHPFSRAQYRETARLCRCLMHHYPRITSQRIVGHQDVAPGRKWDPGVQWSWAHFHRSLAHIRHANLPIAITASDAVSASDDSTPPCAHRSSASPDCSSASPAATDRRS